MIFKIFIGIVLLAYIIYWVVCMCEIFELIKFTPDNVVMDPIKMLIPFYYLFKRNYVVDKEEHELDVECTKDIKDGQPLTTDAKTIKKTTRKIKEETNNIN